MHGSRSTSVLEEDRGGALGMAVGVSGAEEQRAALQENAQGCKHLAGLPGDSLWTRGKHRPEGQGVCPGQQMNQNRENTPQN